jgi:hypothetical protein
MISVPAFRMSPNIWNWRNKFSFEYFCGVTVGSGNLLHHGGSSSDAISALPMVRKDIQVKQWC